MRFSCSQCGKRYATADAPVPGRIYRLKCKSCGNLIVVKGSEAAEGGPATDAAPVSAHPPPLTAEPVAPPLAAPSPAAPPAPDVYRPPAGGGYVDLFADGMATGSSSLPPGQAGEPAAPAPDAGLDDPFARAAPAAVETVDPVPSRDPFADTRAALARAETPPPDASPRLPTPRVPEIPRPVQQRSRPVLLMVAPGVVVLAAIVGFTLWEVSGSKPSPKAAGPAVAARAEKPAAASTPAAAKPAESTPPATAPTSAPAEQPAAAAEAPPSPPPPAVAAAEPEKVEPAGRKPEKKPERPAPEPRRTAQKLAPPAPAPKPADKAAARAEPERPVEKGADKPVAVAVADKPAGKSKGPDTDWEAVAAQEGPSTLTPEEIRKVMQANRKVLDACLANPGRGMDQKLPARQVVLQFTIQPSGTAGYPTIDEVVTSSAPVGQCLKNAVKLIGFPSFSGEPVKAEYPIQIPAS